MQIQKALPIKMYAEAARRSKDPAWLKLRDEAIQRIREFASRPGINRKVMPCLNFSYGKDSTAVRILLEMAKVPYLPRYLDNRAEVKTHELCLPEIDSFFGRRAEIYRTPYSYTEYMRMCIDWGTTNGITLPDGSPINFFDLGYMNDLFLQKVSYCFGDSYATGEPDVLFWWANRSAEGMHKMFAFKQNGDFQEVKPKNSHEVRFWKAEPISQWKDIDVWALLVAENCPVSPIYSYHEIPQRRGSKNKFPQTVWYGASVHWSSEFYRWLLKYSPVQLKEVLDTFPEVRMRFQKGASK